MKLEEEWLARQLISLATRDGILMYQSQALRWACVIIEEWDKINSQNTEGITSP